MRKITVGIVDYGVGNHASVRHTLREIGMRCRTSDDPKVLDVCELLVLPGVGAFRPAIEAVRARGLDSYLLSAAAQNRPLLGICLGMQLLAEGSQENGFTKGLGLISGEVGHLPEGGWHIGWNSIELTRPDPLFGPSCAASARAMDSPPRSAMEKSRGCSSTPRRARPPAASCCAISCRDFAMLKKRLIGVITVKNGHAVQSFGYGRYLPLGKPEVLAKNLDRWGADEILVLSIDRTQRGLGPDLDVLGRIGRLGLSTPVAYGGGVRNAADGGAVVQAGAERVCVDALLRNPDEVRAISALVGAQAVIGVLPLTVQGPTLLSRDYLQRADVPIPAATRTLFAERAISEALVIDWRNEGGRAAFDLELVRRFPLADVPLIVFGGISEPEQLAELFAHERVVAAGVGNFLSYQEHAIQALKLATNAGSLRPAGFQCAP
jgi:imidazole glycerol-phosphate synthase subunit HisF